ncbi:MAG: polysaccharide biosynthesis tyrosine autokinase [Verrucomicrobiales bacterium]|nr:polysaccharide biosynthesis tyrosine autokinase [Verrucomicrobiales bacterium]
MNQFGAGPSQPSSTESMFPGFPSLDIGRLIRVIRRRLWLAAVVAGLFVALAIAYVLTATKIYQSSAVIYVEPKNEGAAFNGLKGAKQASWQTLDALKSMAEGIRNGSVILRVVDQLDLRNDPEFLKPKKGGYTDAEIVVYVSDNVKAELRRGTRLIDISVKDKSPVRAQKMTAAFIEEFQEMIREQNLASADKSQEELQQKAEKQLERVIEAEDGLQEFRMKHTDIALDEDKDFVGKKLADLDKQLSSAANETLLKKGEYDQYKRIADGDAEEILAIGQFGMQDHIQKLLLQRNQKRAEFSRVKEQYRPGHQTYEATKLDLEGLELQVTLAAKEVGNSIEKAYLRAKEHEEDLRNSVTDQKKRLLAVDGVRKEFRTLKGKVDAAYATYQNLLDRINDTDVTKGVDETVIRVFSEPLVPSNPVSPKKKLTVAIAGVFGSMVGMGLVILLGLLDRTLNTRQQVESTLGLSVLAEIPKAFDREWDLKDSVFVTRDPASMVSEGFRSLRTSLSAHMPRSVMVTSASPGEGKSFCSANLAVLQANMGYRTLLVDADFCKPRMAEIFVDPLRGQADQGALVTQNLCQETIFKDLFLMSCGRYTSNTGEPMNGEIFAKMLQDAYQAFDCVIIDTSPLNVVSDGLNYSRHADAVVLVVKSGQTKADSARRSIRELQRMRANLVGCVLNGCEEVNQDQLDYVKGTTRALPVNNQGMPVPAARS